MREAASGSAVKPARWWMAVTVLAGVAGALVAVAAFAKGTYTISPFRVELSAKPSFSGTTELSVRPLPGLEPGVAEAPTHQAPMTFRMTVVGVTQPAAAVRFLGSPEALAKHLRFSNEGREAFGAFGRKLGIVAAAGAAVGGLAVSFGRWKRIVGGLVSGALVIGVIAILLHQTWDANEFRDARFRRTESAATSS